MTLPKTHPLYGAVETLSDLISFRRYRVSAATLKKMDLDVALKHVEAEALETIRALESAGYRVVGLESIPDIAEAAGNHAWTTYKHKGQWEWQKLLRISIAAAPTITETEKGG